MSNNESYRLVECEICGGTIYTGDLAITQHNQETWPCGQGFLVESDLIHAERRQLGIA